MRKQNFYKWRLWRFSIPYTLFFFRFDSTQKAVELFDVSTTESGVRAIVRQKQIDVKQKHSKLQSQATLAHEYTDIALTIRIEK